MIFNPPVDLAHTGPRFAKRHTDLLAPIIAFGVSSIISWNNTSVNDPGLALAYPSLTSRFQEEHREANGQ
jgi:hypothetical protein